MKQKVPRITKKEIEYEMLHILRDTALLYNRMNPENKFLHDIVRHIDECIDTICEGWDLYEDY